MWTYNEVVYVVKSERSENSLIVEALPKIDKDREFPKYQAEGYSAICAEMRRMFDEVRHHNRVGADVWQRQSSQVDEVVRLLDTLPDQDNLSLKITKVVACRIGAQICWGPDYRRASEYLQIAEENQSVIRELTPASNGPRPWWVDLEKNWKCFFNSTTF